MKRKKKPNGASWEQAGSSRQAAADWQADVSLNLNLNPPWSEQAKYEDATRVKPKFGKLQKNMKCATKDLKRHMA